MGLGAASAVSLADARKKADAARRLLADGVDPLDAKHAAEKPVVPTFGRMAEELVASIAKGLRNKKHIHQWCMTLSIQRDKDSGELLDTGYCLPLRNKLVPDVNTEDVLEILQPIWTEKAETAQRLRGRIERVLDAAKAKGHRTGENPARWRGHLDHLMARRKKLRRGHHPAMPYADVPAFVRKLREREAVAALMMEFTVLCVPRTNEVIGAKWPEIDRKAKVWSVPPERMKADKPHRVPLGPRALEILDIVENLSGQGDWIFPGHKRGRPFSNMAMLTLLQVRMNLPQFTVHGFRSSFRDWVDEQTSFPGEIAEAALAHTVGDETERAYRRGDALEKRRKLMLAWEEFVTAPAGMAAEGSAAE